MDGVAERLGCAVQGEGSDVAVIAVFPVLVVHAVFVAVFVVVARLHRTVVVVAQRA